MMNSVEQSFRPSKLDRVRTCVNIKCLTNIERTEEYVSNSLQKLEEEKEQSGTTLSSDIKDFESKNEKNIEIKSEYSDEKLAEIRKGSVGLIRPSISRGSPEPSHTEKETQTKKSALLSTTIKKPNSEKIEEYVQQEHKVSTLTSFIQFAASQTVGFNVGSQISDIKTNQCEPITFQSNFTCNHPSTEVGATNTIAMPRSSFIEICSSPRSPDITSKYLRYVGGKANPQNLSQKPINSSSFVVSHDSKVDTADPIITKATPNLQSPNHKPISFFIPNERHVVRNREIKPGSVRNQRSSSENPTSHRNSVVSSVQNQVNAKRTDETKIGFVLNALTSSENPISSRSYIVSTDQSQERAERSGETTIGSLSNQRSTSTKHLPSKRSIGPTDLSILREIRTEAHETETPQCVSQSPIDCSRPVEQNGVDAIEPKLSGNPELHFSRGTLSSCAGYVFSNGIPTNGKLTPVPPISNENSISKSNDTDARFEKGVRIQEPKTTPGLSNCGTRQNSSENRVDTGEIEADKHEDANSEAVVQISLLASSLIRKYNLRNEETKSAPLGRACATTSANIRHLQEKLKREIQTSGSSLDRQTKASNESKLHSLSEEVPSRRRASKGRSQSRSKSRSKSVKRSVIRAPTPNRRDRPYRQWLGVSNCVTADTRFIINSKKVHCSRTGGAFTKTNDEDSMLKKKTPIGETSLIEASQEQLNPIESDTSMSDMVSELEPKAPIAEEISTIVVPGSAHDHGDIRKENGQKEFDKQHKELDRSSIMTDESLKQSNYSVLNETSTRNPQHRSGLWPWERPRQSSSFMGRTRKSLADRYSEKKKSSSTPVSIADMQPQEQGHLSSGPVSVHRQGVRHKRLLTTPHEKAMTMERGSQSNVPSDSYVRKCKLKMSEVDNLQSLLEPFPREFQPAESKRGSVTALAECLNSSQNTVPETPVGVQLLLEGVNEPGSSHGSSCTSFSLSGATCIATLRRNGQGICFSQPPVGTDLNYLPGTTTLHQLYDTKRPRSTSKNKKNDPTESCSQEKTPWYCQYFKATNGSQTLVGAAPPMINSLQKDGSTSLSKGFQCRSLIRSHTQRKAKRKFKPKDEPQYVHVQALKDHHCTLPGELGFKKGQIIKMKIPSYGQIPGEVPLCYGSYKVGRFRRKKQGLFPASLVEPVII